MKSEEWFLITGACRKSGNPFLGFEMKKNEIDLSLNQPLEDLMSSYYEYINSFEELEKADLYEAVSNRDFHDVESYLIHMNVI